MLARPRICFWFSFWWFLFQSSFRRKQACQAVHPASSAHFTSFFRRSKCHFAAGGWLAVDCVQLAAAVGSASLLARDASGYFTGLRNPMPQQAAGITAAASCPQSTGRITPVAYLGGVSVPRKMAPIIKCNEAVILRWRYPDPGVPSRRLTRFSHADPFRQTRPPLSNPGVAVARVGGSHGLAAGRAGRGVHLRVCGFQ